MIDYERVGGIVTITLNAPERLNAVRIADLEELSQCWQRFREDPEARVAVVTATGDRAFCAGADRTELATAFAEDHRADFWRDHARGYGTSPEDGMAQFKPTICAINGWAVGAGLVIALGTDIRICSDHARFSMPEVQIGISTVTGAARLPAIVGPAWASYLALTGEPIDAELACRIGLVNEVCAAADLMPRAYEIADRIARNAPLAVWATKEIAVRAQETPYEVVKSLGESLRRQVFDSEDFSEGMRASQEGRPPRFTGR